MINKKNELERLINKSSIISIKNKRNLRKNIINLSDKEIDNIYYTLANEKNIIKNLLKNWYNKSKFELFKYELERNIVIINNKNLEKKDEDFIDEILFNII